MSISQNSKALLMKLVTTQQTITWCNNFSKASHRVLGKRSLKTQPLKHTTKWRRKQSALRPPNKSSMACTNNLLGMPCLNLVSRQIGRCEDNVPRTIKVNNLSDKGLTRLPSTPPPHWDHGIINQFWWILIEQEHQEEIGEGKGEVCKEGT